MHRGDSGGDGMNALGPIRLIRISYYGIFALTESLEGFGGATQLQDQRLLPRKRLSLLELPIDIPRLIQWKSLAQVRPILCWLFIQISFLMTTEDFDPGKESSKRCWQQSFSALFLHIQQLNKWIESPPGPRILSRLELLSYRIVAILTTDAEYVANAADA